MQRRNQQGYIPLEVEDSEDQSEIWISNDAKETVSWSETHENGSLLQSLSLKLSLSKYRIIGIVAFIAFLIILVSILTPKSQPKRLTTPPQYLPDIIYLEDANISYPQFGSIFNRSQTRSFELLLFGDSLIDVPWKYYQLRSFLYENIMEGVMFRENTTAVSFNISISHFALGGATIQTLKESLPRIFKDNCTYDGILMFWDSDISDQAVEVLNLPSAQQKYQEDVRSVLSILRQHTPLIGIAGPGLLGEGPLFLGSKFQDKEPLLNQYRGYNQQIALDLNISYLNIRKGFQELIPSYHILSFGYVTRDGEHPNAFGTQVIAKYFATQFLRWYDQH